MKRCDRYLLRLFAWSLGATTLFLVGLYLILHFLSHLKHHEDARESFAAVGMGLAEGLCRYYWLHLPEILVLFGPYALLFAAMFTLHHLEQGNELIPIRAVGVSRRRLTLPLYLAAALVSLGLVALKEVVIPGQARDMVIVSRQMRGKSDAVQDDLDLLADGRGNVFHARRWDAGTLRLEDVTLLPREATRPLRFEFLEWFDEEDGGRFVPAPGSDLDEAAFAALSDLEAQDVGEENRVLRRSSWFRLRRLALRADGDRRLAMLAAEHLAYPFSAIVLMLMGIPLVMRRRGTNVFAGLLLCLALSLGFFAMNLLMSRLGAQSPLIAPDLAAFLPVFLVGAIGLLLQDLGR
ncbi:MAG: LptF/LptG family permease [Planctomycetes bacterium]|nr:LptF/LptG family permease [Planctomycetota bacterium]